MKHQLAFLPLLLLSLVTHAQPWLENLPQGKHRTQLTLHDYQNAFYSYWEPFGVVDGYYYIDGVKHKAGGYKQFKRWEWLQEQRAHPVTGEFPKKSANQIVEAYKATHPHRGVPPRSEWISLGPFSSDRHADGLGRINVMGFHPTDPNMYWAGAPSGGLWVTRDDGNTWQCLTDHLESLGATDIVIDRDFETNQTIYIATGDRDDYDNYSIGVLKSTDAGATWQTTGIQYELNEFQIVNRIIQDYTDPLTLYAATSRGVFRTKDGGDTWDEQLTETAFIDMEMHPVNPDILYGSTNMGIIHVSHNAGQTWSTRFLESGARRTELAVTPADPTRVYAITTSGGLDGIYRSDDEGMTFTEVFDGATLNLMHWNSNGIGEGGQSWYNLAIAASPLNPDFVVVGGINTWLSEDGGYTWKIISGLGGTGLGDAVHVDKHFLMFRGEALWEGNDGGVYVTRDTGFTWKDQTNGMAISQMYRLALSKTEPFEVLTGLQDNGTKHLSANTWDHVNGGDGTEALIDHLNADTQYSTTQYGSIYRTYDRWKSARYVKAQAAGEGLWVTPFAMDPVNPDIIYGGYRELWKSTDQCSTWTQVSQINATQKIEVIAIAPSDPNIIYIAEQFKLWKTTTAGGDFERLDVVDITNTNNMTSIAVRHDDPQTLWVSIGGFWEGGVYAIYDGGATYENISEGLPLIPVYSVVQNRQYDGIQLFAGTELGVYVKTDDEPWMPFSEGLPNVIVTELDIYYDPNPKLSKLRCSTYGRGAWETRIDFSDESMQYVSSTCTQASTENVKPNQKRVEILSVRVTTTGELHPLHLQTIQFSSVGSTNGPEDIAAARLYSTGSVNAYSDIHEVAFLESPGDEFVFNVGIPLQYGDNYFWLAYDVDLYATLGNVVDAQLISFDLGETVSPVETDPAGSRLIDLWYCDAGSTVTTSEHITRVIAGNVEQTSMRGPNGYEDFTNRIIETSWGQTIDVAVTNSFPHPTNDLRAWIDWNQDGEMEYPAELCYASGPSGVTEYQFNIDVPVTARTGMTRMRIRLHDNNFGSNWDPCGNASLGEVEDYGVMISEESTSSENAASCRFQVYPNPVEDILYIHFEHPACVAHLDLYNLYGQLVRSFQFESLASIDVHDVIQGIYFLRINEEIVKIAIH